MLHTLLLLHALHACPHCAYVYVYLCFCFYFIDVNQALLYMKFADLQRLRSGRSEVFLHRYFSSILLKFLNHFSLHVQNLGVAVFRKHLSVTAFIVIDINSLFSFVFIVLAVFTNRILEHFLFIILTLHSVVSFYVYVYGWWVNGLYEPNL